MQMSLAANALAWGPRALSVVTYWPAALLRPYSINLVLNAFVHLYDSTGDFKPDLLKSEPLLLPVKRHMT
jgi:hypothetical protein